MKSYINLLPKEQQREVALDRIGTRILHLLVWVVFSFIVLASLLMLTKIFLKAKIAGIGEKIENQKQILASGENSELKARLKKFNIHLNNLTILGQNQAFWSDVMVEFAKIMPKEIAIDTMSVDRTSGKIRITGYSKTRDAVLDFRENLLDSDYFRDVNFPLSNLVEPTDVNFRYTFYVEDELLKKNL